MLKWSSIVVVVLFMFVGFTGQVLALDDPQDVTSQTAERDFKLEIELEYMAPVDKDRQIDTTTLNILFSKAEQRFEHVSFYYGATLLYATGDITRHHKKYENSAFGIGPILLVRYEPFKGEKFSFSLDASGALVFYNEDFPAGGDFYNFEWRVGPTLSYQINEKVSVNLSYKFMHVSNGQHENNPAYNADGISLGVTVSF